MHNELTDISSAADLRIGLVVSRYHADVTEALREAAVRTFTGAGGQAGDLEVVACPGSFELPAVCLALARRGDLDAVVALGCVLAGETTHDQHIASAVAMGLTMVTVQTGVPVAFGVLTCRTMAQARQRAGGDRGNKGAEAMAAAIETARALRELAGAKGRT